ncbi:MAG TPA: hypothetical protein VND64_32470 [Pirellulales bacterium]|nr:hypothetical protein [Pirellulales bacterium]
MDQWLHDLEFACSYRFSVARAATAEQALAGQFATEISDGRVRGVFNKAGALMRCSGDPGPPPVVISETPDGATIGFLDFDEVSSADLLLSYLPLLDPRNPRGSATFSPRNPATGSNAARVGKYGAGSNSCRKVSAISIDGDDPGSYLRAPDGAAAISTTVAHIDNERVTVLLKYEYRGMPTEKRVEFRLGGTLPVVEKVLKEYDHQGQHFEDRSQAFEFVECRGGPLPRTVRAAMKNPHPQFPDLPWLVHEWHSDDLGARAPTPEDFLVPIAADRGMDTRNLRNAGLALRDGKLDITKISLHDLQDDGSTEGRRTDFPAAETPAGRRDFSWKTWLIVGNLAAVVVIVVALIRRTQRKQATDRKNVGR